MGDHEKNIVDKRKVAAVIRISGYNENPQRAIQSVIRNHKRFGEVHIVHYGWSEETTMYAGWEKDQVLLKKYNIPVIVHSKLNPDRIKMSLVVELPCYCQLMEGGMNTLMEQVKSSVKDHQSLTHFAVESITVIKSDVQLWKKRPIMVPDAFTSYGFLIAMMVFDFIRRYWINFGQWIYSGWGAKYALTTDLRAVLVYKTYKRNKLADEQFWWKLYNPNHHPVTYGGQGVIIAPEVDNQGWRYVMWYFHHHRHLTWGIWLFAFVFYYWFLSWPWWNAFVANSDVRAFHLLIRPNDWPIVLGAWVVHSLYAMSVTSKYMEVPFQYLLCCLQPFFIAALPLVLLYAQFHQSRAGWHLNSLKGQKLEQ